MKKLCSSIILSILTLTSVCSFAGTTNNVILLPPATSYANNYEIEKSYSAHVRQIMPDKTNLLIEVKSEWSSSRFGPVRVDRTQEEWYNRLILVHGHPQTLNLTTDDVMPSGRFYFVSNYTYKTTLGGQNTIRVYNYSSKP